MIVLPSFSPTLKAFTASVGGGATYLYNGLTTTPLHAWSLRKLSSTHTSAITVRRTSDNATQVIGFDASGNLDTTALMAFVGSSYGVVTQFWDVSGTNHLTTSDFCYPHIVLAGVLCTKNGKPAIYFGGGDQPENDWGASLATSPLNVSPNGGYYTYQQAVAATNDTAGTALRPIAGNVNAGTAAGGLNWAFKTASGTSRMLVNALFASDGFEGSAISDVTAMAVRAMEVIDVGTSTIYNPDGSPDKTQANFGNVDNSQTVFRIGGQGAFQPALMGYIQEVLLWRATTQVSFADKAAANLSARSYWIPSSALATNLIDGGSAGNMSADFDASSWGFEGGMSVVKNGVANPLDGAPTADTVTWTGAYASLKSNPVLALTAGDKLCFSFYAKKGSWSGSFKFYLLTTGYSNILDVSFDVNGTSGATGFDANSRMTDLGNGWWRISGSMTIPSTATYLPYCGLMSYQAMSVPLFGAMLEKGSLTPTTYNPDA